MVGLLLVNVEDKKIVRGKASKWIVKVRLTFEAGFSVSSKREAA